jgi:CubicO group peptidase (beta-lactamase class C family)
MTSTNSAQNAISSLVDSGELAGAAALIWRDGAVREVVTAGRRDLASGAPVERETIFRIASLTKPVTTVAALSMLDDGRFALDEPITGCAPELTDLRVLRDPNGPLEECDVAARPITFRDLLTHRSGLTA